MGSSSVTLHSPCLGIQRLETQRLVIRLATKADLEAVFSIHADEEVNRYIPYETWLSPDDAIKWYERVQKRRIENDAEQFVVVRKRDRKIIGTCIAFDFDQGDQSCEFGYVLNRADWNRGYMIEAMLALIDGLISQPAINAVRAVVQGENVSSLKLLDKLGFKVVHTEKINPGSDGEFCIRYHRLSSP